MWHWQGNIPPQIVFYDSIPVYLNKKQQNMTMVVYF